MEEQRPKLKLNPRTLPLSEGEVKPDEPEVENEEEPLAEETPSQPRPKPVSAASIFGAAKPVDTAAKDREIEERLERERVEKKALEEKEKAEREEKEKAVKEEKEKAAVEEGNKENPEAVEDGKEAEEEEGAKEATDEAETKPAAEASAPTPTAAVPIPSEPISWRRKNDDDAEEPSKTQSPPRRRFSPNRRPRRNGKSNSSLISIPLELTNVSIILICR